MRRFLAAALLLSGLAVLGSTELPAAAAPAEAAPEQGVRYDLGGDAIGPPPGSALARQRPRTWPGHTIRYHETIPAKWDWSLDQAIEHWNRAGGRIRFVETSAARARLRIGYGDTGGADGVGTLGYQRSNYVHLSTAYRRADAQDADTRVWVGRLLTHELGHVLGFDHTGGQCSLMYPVYDAGTCPPLPDSAPGYYNCRWIDRALLRRFVAMYGGRAKQPPRLCLIEALPEPLRDVRFAGGVADESPVTITWRPQPRARGGTKVWVTVWSASSCDKEPNAWERRRALDPAAGTWTDPAYGVGPWCYRAEIVNRYGAGRTAEVRRIDRWAPVPEAPDVGAPTWVPEEGAWRFTWSAPDRTSLAVVRNGDDPATCPTGVEDRSDLVPVDGDGWLLGANATVECVQLVAHTEWGTVSPPTQVELRVPGAGEAPEVGTPVWVPEDAVFRVSWSPPDQSTSLELMRSVDDPTACPPTYDAGRAEPLPQPEPGRWDIAPLATTECVTLFAVTAGLVSPGVTVQLRMPVPDAPTPPAPVWLAEDGQWQFAWSPPPSTRLGVVRNLEDPASCPTATDDWSELERGDGDHWLLASSAPDECVLLVAYTEWGTVSAGTRVRLTVPGVGEAPDVGTPVWVPEERSFRVAWTPPDGDTHLEVVRPAEPGDCPSSYADGFPELANEGGLNQWLVLANQVSECVLFVAVSGDSTSPGTPVVLRVPAPTATPTVGDVAYDPDTGRVLVSASLEGRYPLGVEVVPGACPDQPPGDADWADGYETSAGVWTLFADPGGTYCALFAALGQFDLHGPVVTRTFTVP